MQKMIEAMTTLELADIFHEYGEAYRQKYACAGRSVTRPSSGYEGNWKLSNWGTSRGQLYGCIPCQEFEYSYHSCSSIVIVPSVSMNWH